MSGSRRTVAPASVAGVTVVLSAAALVLAGLLGVTPAGFLVGNEANQWLAGLGSGVIGAAVLRAGRNRLGPLFAAFGLLAVLAAVSQEYAPLAHRAALPLAGLAAWLAAIAWLPAFIGTVLVVPLLFPDGRLASPRWRRPARLGVTAAAVGFVLFATTQQAMRQSGFGWMRNPFDLPGPDGPQLTVGLVLLAGSALVGLAAALAILWRMRCLTGPDRTRSALFALAVLCGLVTLLPVLPVVSLALNVVSYLAIGVGIVRYRLFDVETYLPRALGYVLLVGLAVGVYLTVATLVAAQANPGLVAAFATAVVVLLLSRVLGRTQALIGRLMFGDRRRPQAALDALGVRLAAAVDTDDVLPASVEAVRRSLRLPYAAVTLVGEHRPASMTGVPPRRTASFVLSHAGEQVGTLTVGLRAGERELATEDARVLTGFVQQVAVAAHGVQVTRELRRSREQVVLTREAERSRIRRDLHDGIGPALAGISLGLETAGRVVARGGAGAAALLEELRAATTACVDDVRRIVSDLRPPVLDEVGLLGALRHQADLLNNQAGGRLSVAVADDAALGELPPGVEVAAYRIVTEAITNAVRHSGATRCDVTVDREAALRLRVSDDGSGEPPVSRGTGLDSMRQRAEELGGRCVVIFQPGRGTVVEAELPLELGIPA